MSKSRAERPSPPAESTEAACGADAVKARGGPALRAGCERTSRPSPVRESRPQPFDGLLSVLGTSLERPPRNAQFRSDHTKRGEKPQLV